MIPVDADDDDDDDHNEYLDCLIIASFTTKPTLVNVCPSSSSVIERDREGASLEINRCYERTIFRLK